MTTKEQVIKMVQNNPKLIEEMLEEFCPYKFGIPNSFIAMDMYECVNVCEHCWNRTEEEITKDKQVWEDYKRTDFNNISREEWYDKWGLEEFSEK